MPFLQKVQPKQGRQVAPPQALTPSVQHTLDAFAQQVPPADRDEVAKIEVHDTVSNVAWAYEKLRQAIDYQDEHLLRKNAVERIIKRRLVAGVTAEAIAEPLVMELIRGRYLPNNHLPTTIIQEAATVINAYIHLWTQVPTLADPRESDRLFNWIVSLMAVQLNELFAPAAHSEALAALMLQVVHRDVAFAPEEMDEQQKNTQLYIAIHRVLLKSDSGIISYHLFLRQHPEWADPDQVVTAALGHRLPEIKKEIDRQLLHPAGELVQRLMKKYAIIFTIFDDLAELHGPEATEFFSQPDELVKEIKATYAKRRKTVTWRIARNIIRSIIYVFLTKMVLTLLVEMPLDKLIFGDQVSNLPLIINTSFPPFLLFFIGVTIRPPGKKNEEAVMKKVQDLVYRGDERHVLVKPRKPIRRNALFTFFYRLIYGLTFILVFGGIITVLTYYHFTPISTAIFLLFLTIVSFFGIRVRLLAKELLVVDQRESIFTVLFDFFTVPILQVGRWIALRAPKVNVLIFFLDVIIEAPFKAFLEATEGFLGFLREKREEIY